jgi:hypothetical protein
VNGTKILLVVLLLVVVLFVVLVVRGPRPSPQKDPASFNAAPHPMLASFNEILGPFAPKLAVTALSPSQKTFDLLSTSNYSVKILPDSSHDLRKADFVVSPVKSCARLAYTASDGNADDPLKSQASDQDPQHPDQFSFVIAKGGGTLVIQRKQQQPGACVVVLN